MSGWRWQPGRQQPPAAAVLGAGLATVVAACWAGALRAPARPARPILEPTGHLSGDSYAAPCFSSWCGSRFSSLVILWVTACPLWARMLRSEGALRGGEPALPSGSAQSRSPCPPQLGERWGKGTADSHKAWAVRKDCLEEVACPPEAARIQLGLGRHGGSGAGLLSWSPLVGAGVVAFPEGCSASCVPSRGVQICSSVFQGPKVAPWRDDTAKLSELDSCGGPVGQRTPGAKHPTALAFRDQTRWPSGGPLGSGSEPGWVLRG